MQLLAGFLHCNRAPNLEIICVSRPFFTRCLKALLIISSVFVITNFSSFHIQNDLTASNPIPNTTRQHPPELQYSSSFYGTISKFWNPTNIYWFTDRPRERLHCGTKRSSSKIPARQWWHLSILLASLFFISSCKPIERIRLVPFPHHPHPAPGARFEAPNEESPNFI